MKTWTIPVSWSMCGKIEIEADTLEEAIEIAETDDTIGLPDGDYLEESWQVDDDIDIIRSFYNDDQEDENITDEVD